MIDLSQSAPAAPSRTVEILYHNHGRLGNQLWLYASVLAYCLEEGYALRNPSFFEYARHFRMQAVDGWRKRVFFDTYTWHRDRRIGRLAYLVYVWCIRVFFFRRVARIRHTSANSVPFYLAPTRRLNALYPREERLLRESEAPTLYLDGWLFRNPEGIAKFHPQIRSYLRPNENIERFVDGFMTGVRATYQHVVGVHIRQGDYRRHDGGAHYREPRDVARILTEYLHRTHRKYVGFVLCSDEPLDPADFAGLPVVFARGNEASDLFTLAACDLIIGSNSTYGAFASYYGDIPFEVFSHEPVDWAAVDAREGYAENKRATMVCY
jgi:hypothetical protein